MKKGLAQSQNLNRFDTNSHYSASTLRSSKKTNNNDKTPTNFDRNSGKQGTVQAKSSTSHRQNRNRLAAQSQLLDNYNIVSPQQQMKNLKSSQTVHKFGLQLEPICNKAGHDRSKITYVCAEISCINNRLACAHCFLDEHVLHADQKVNIDQFQESLKINESNYYNSLHEFKEISKEIESPEFLNKIMDEMEEIKKYLCQRIDEAKAQIQRQFESAAAEINIKYNEQIQKQKKFQIQLENAIQRNIFNMDQEQLQTLTDLYQGNQEDLIQKTKDDIEKQLLHFDNLFLSGFDSYKACFRYELDQVFDAYEKIKLPPDLSDSTLKLLHLRGKLDSKRKKLQENYDLQKEINELVDEIYEIEDVLGMHLIEHQHVNEEHVSTVPIFECCQQAFKCAICHDNYCKDHKSYITFPSKRYCLNCQVVFQVNHYTNVPIVCLQCRKI